MVEAARVTRITEYGDARLRTAIAQGLVSADVKADIERTLRAVEIANRENTMLRKRNVELEAIRREDARRHIEGYKERLRARGLIRSIRTLVIAGALMGAMVAITAASVAVRVMT